MNRFQPSGPDPHWASSLASGRPETNRNLMKTSVVIVVAVDVIVRNGGGCDNIIDGVVVDFVMVDAVVA